MFLECSLKAKGALGKIFKKKKHRFRSADPFDHFFINKTSKRLGFLVLLDNQILK